MSKRRDFSEILENEMDPNVIIKALVGSTERKSSRRARHNVMTDAEVQTTIVEEEIPNECVRNWLFTQSPDIKIQKVELDISPAISLEKNEDKNNLRAFDAGDYPNDPILKALRKKLRSL